MENKNVSGLLIDTAILFLNMLITAIKKQDEQTLMAMGQVLEALRKQLQENEPGAAFSALQKIQTQLFKI